MNSDLIMQILQWLVPSGIAGSLWAWLRHRENNKVLAAKERNDAYKEMYDNLSGTLIDLQNENIKLYKAKRQPLGQKRVRSPAAARSAQHGENEISDGYAGPDSGGHRL